jgi:hypothetical protein
MVRRMRSTKTARKRRSARIASRSQREVLRDVLLSATECGTWLTLRELSQLTRYGEASISAQLRHLRKPRYGAFPVVKQIRKDDVGRGTEARAAWEYRLRRDAPARPVEAWLAPPEPASTSHDLPVNHLPAA